MTFIVYCLCLLVLLGIVDCRQSGTLGSEEGKGMWSGMFEYVKGNEVKNFR